MLAMFTLCLSASDVVVSYEPSEYGIEYDIDFDRYADQSISAPNVKVVEFSAKEPLLKNNVYSGYSGPSIYGGYQFESTNPEWIFNREQIRFNHQGSHPITMQCYSKNGWADAEMALHVVIIFKKEDFKKPFNKGDVRIDGLSVKWNTYFTGSERNVSGRYVVEIGGVYYVSDFDFNMTNSGSSEIGKQNLVGVKWAPYHPEDNLNFDDRSAEYNSLDLSDVMAVGLYVEEDQWFGNATPTSPYMLGIAAFEAKGEAK